MRYIVERIVGTLTYRVIDTSSHAPVPVLIAGHVLTTVFDTREEAQKIAANCNRDVWSMK